MSISAKESQGGTVMIHLEERFTFESYQSLRETYINRGTGTKYIIDFKSTDYIDSSALGMLLVMREVNGEVAHSIILKNCKESVKKVFQIASFNEMFDIE